MRITVNFNKPQEIIVNQSKRIKKRPNDDYDYTDPIFEQSDEDIELVKIEPSITDFYVYNPNSIPKKTDNSLDSQIVKQNELYKKILSKENSNLDLFIFLITDLIINNDLEFKRCLKKLSDKKLFVDEINVDFLKNNFFRFEKYFLEFEDEVKGKIKGLPINLNNEVEFNGGFFLLVYEYVELSAILRCYKKVVEEKKTFFYKQFKKSIYVEIKKMFETQPNNIKMLGKLVSGEVKKNKKDKFTKYSLEYLTLDEDNNQ